MTSTMEVSMTAVEIGRTRLEVASLDLQADTILEARYVASAGMDQTIPCLVSASSTSFRRPNRPKGSDVGCLNHSMFEAISIVSPQPCPTGKSFLL